jgi:hypothetical protein
MGFDINLATYFSLMVIEGAIYAAAAPTVTRK